VESIITYKFIHNTITTKAWGIFLRLFVWKESMCCKVGRCREAPSGRLLGVWGVVVDRFGNMRFKLLKEY